MLMQSTDRYRRQAHSAAWYDSPSDQPGNLPIALRNPFGKRKSTASTRIYNDLRVQEAGETDGRTLRPVTMTAQDSRSTTPQDGVLELGLDHERMEAPLDDQESESPPRVTETPEIRVVIPPLRSASVSIAPTESNGQPRSFGIGRCDSPVAAHDLVRPISDIPSKPRHQQPPRKISSTSSEHVETVSGPTLTTQIRAVLFGSWLNVLLFMIPAGFAVQLTNGNPALIFSLNFIAIIPLGRILSLATKDLVLRLGGLSATAVIMTFG